MANHKSAILRIKKNETARLRNKYFHKTTRNAIRDLKEEKDRKKADKSLKSVYSMLDKLVKRNIISKNKSANLKSQLTKQVNSLKVSKGKVTKKPSETLKEEGTKVSKKSSK